MLYTGVGPVSSFFNTYKADQHCCILAYDQSKPRMCQSRGSCADYIVVISTQRLFNGLQDLMFLHSSHAALPSPEPCAVIWTATVDHATLYAAWPPTHSSGTRITPRRPVGRKSSTYTSPARYLPMHKAFPLFWEWTLKLTAVNL